jgi:hypothetical protein
MLSGDFFVKIVIIKKFDKKLMRYACM